MATTLLSSPCPSMDNINESTVREIVSEMERNVKRNVKRIAAPIGEALSLSSCGTPITWDRHGKVTRQGYKKNTMKAHSDNPFTNEKSKGLTRRKAIHPHRSETLATTLLSSPCPSMDNINESIVREIVSEMERNVKRIAAPIGEALSLSSCGTPITWDRHGKVTHQGYKKNTMKAHSDNPFTNEKPKGLTRRKAIHPHRSETPTTMASTNNSNNNTTSSSSSTSHQGRTSRDKIDKRAEIEHTRKLWRAFRKKMRSDRQKAIIEEELKMREGNDALIQENEQENEEWALAMSQPDPLIVVDSTQKPSMHKMILPPGFLTSNNRKTDPVKQSTNNKMKDLDEDGLQVKREKSLFTSPGGTLMDMFHLIIGNTWNFYKKGGNPQYDEDRRNDSTTVVTSDETVSLSSRSESVISQVSWQSWNSALTEKACNRDQVMMNSFGNCGTTGKDDTPWKAAKRGDLQTLIQRWKNRHDWTMQNEDGDEPLYLACRYGGARNPRIVLFLLQQWPSTEHIPKSLMARCIEDSVNVHVEKILLHPNLAEMIIRDFEVHVLGGGGSQKHLPPPPPLNKIREEPDLE